MSFFKISIIGETNELPSTGTKGVRLRHKKIQECDNFDKDMVNYGNINGFW